MKNIYLIVGKSGSGKSTIVQELCKRYNYKEVQSYTERPRRYEGETGHIFITKDEFDALEDLCAYTLFNGNRYGVPSSVVDKSDLYVIDTAGVKYMYEHYKGYKNIIVIGVCCSCDEHKDELIRMKRMIDRGDSLEEAEARVINDRNAFADFDRVVHYKIFNSDLEESVNALHSIILDTM